MQYGYCAGESISLSGLYFGEVECFDKCRNIDDATGCTYEMDQKTCSYYNTNVTFAAGRDGIISDPASARNICWIFSHSRTD